MKTEIGSSSETSSLWFCDSVLYTYIVILETEIGGSSRVIYWFSMTQYHIIHIVIMETEIGSSRVTYWFSVTQYHIISYHIIHMLAIWRQRQIGSMHQDKISILVL